jgi:hypothetical protein
MMAAKLDMRALKVVDRALLTAAVKAGMWCAQIRVFDNKPKVFGVGIGRDDTTTTHMFDLECERWLTLTEEGPKIEANDIITPHDRQLLAAAYREQFGESGPYPAYAELALKGDGAFTLCSLRAIARARIEAEQNRQSKQ